MKHHRKTNLMNIKKSKQKNAMFHTPENKHMELVADKIIRTAKFEHTVHSLDRDFGERWNHFKNAWLHENF